METDPSDERSGSRSSDERHAIERATHVVSGEIASARRFDLLVLDYQGVCTPSHDEFLAAAGTDTLGERERSSNVVADAQAAGLTVVVVSNEIEPAWIARSEVLSRVDHVLACSDNGIFKPDRRAFQRAALVTGIEAARALVVDDEIDNVRGAQAAGMSAIRFDTANPEASWDAVDAALRGA